MEIATQDNLAQVCDPHMLRTATRLSSLAYNENIGADNEFPHGSQKFTAWYSSACAFLLRGIEYDALVFRGTQEKFDFLIDAMAIPVRYGNTWCHAGFAFSQWSVWRKIKHFINPAKPLLVTGHSLGGGNADKTCDFLAGHNADVHMITFGKPNVHLKRQGVPYRKFLKTHLSVISGSDLVTRLPRFLYTPHPTQSTLYLSNDGTNYVNVPREYIKKDFELADSLSDHSMVGQYKKRIDEMLDW